MLPFAIFGPPGHEQEFLIKNGDHYGTKFLRDGIDYQLPEYLCIISNKRNKVTFNLLVEDVVPNSQKVVVDDDDRSVCVRFSVITMNPHAATHYAFMVKLPVLSIEDADLQIKAKKVVLKIPFQPDDEELGWFLCGKTDSDLEKKIVENYQMRMDDTSFEQEHEPAGAEGEDEPDSWETTDL